MSSIIFTTGATVTFKPLLEYITTYSFINDFLINEANISTIVIQYGNEIDSNSGKNLSKLYFNELLSNSDLIEKLGLSITNLTNDKSVITFESGSKQLRDKNFRLVVFPFHGNINHFISKSDVVVSHAGTGSIIDSLRLYKPLIVVTNESLMDNHQVEVADELSKFNCLLAISLNQLSKGELQASISKIIKGEVKFDALPTANNGIIESVIADELSKGSTRTPQTM